MQPIRSLIFHPLFLGWSALVPVMGLPLILLPRGAVVGVMRLYCRGALWMARHVAGIMVEMRGTENLPADGRYILAAKHQSTLETLVLPLWVRDPAIVLKRELYLIPIFGWVLWRIDMIAVRRGARRQAVTQMIAGAQRCLRDQGRPLIIFPQGTRVAVGDWRPYRWGLAALYEALEVPVVPVALNCGAFWPRRKLRLRPGRTVIEILDPMPPGESPTDMLVALEQRIEQASNALARAAGAPETPLSDPETARARLARRASRASGDD